MNRIKVSCLLALCILTVLATSCVWRSGRDSGGTVSENSPQNSTVDANAQTAESASKRPAQRFKQADTGDFIVQKLPVQNTKYGDIHTQISDEKLLEKAADKLNRALILPKDIFLRAQDCGEQNASYDPETSTVTICYELMEHYYRIFRKAGSDDEKAYAKMFDAVKFVFLHEIAHALIDAYEIPITGSEEDAADRCSAFINLTELGDDGVRSVFAAADAFKLDGGEKIARGSLANEHLLEEQRFYNSLCLIYGSDTKKFTNIVSSGYLPRERAARCADEYQRNADSWTALLGEWRKN